MLPEVANLGPTLNFLTDGLPVIRQEPPGREIRQLAGLGLWFQIRNAFHPVTFDRAFLRTRSSP